VFKVITQKTREFFQKFSPFLFLFQLNTLLFCSSPWYRELPQKDFTKNKDFKGVWKKFSNPRSAINSSWHKNVWTEVLEIEDTEFKKVYTSEDLIGSQKTSTEIIGKGNYEVKGNWLLLKTKTIDTKIIEDTKIMKNNSESKNTQLLYYFNSDLNYLFPMIYDTAYRESEFGVKEGVTRPYDESEKNFHEFMKIYAFKDYQPHIYAKVN
jgi:hypothetical protein